MIVNVACALMLIFNAMLGPALSTRPVISSIPVTNAVIDSAWLIVVIGIVTKKSIYPEPMIVFDADAFANTPPNKPINDAVTVNAFAFVAGLFDNETRMTKDVPATNVPFPVW